ncbi:MAG TPA: hypothetical protein VMD55_03560 [Terracidiphilus sp.]|nr:hypothetical protein [Terracidiphilus sp.]
MANPGQPKKKSFSFGSCDFANTSPEISALSPNTEVLNIRIDFEEALKIHLAIGECIRTLNSYNRATRAGRRTALNLAIHLSKKRLAVNQTNLPV